MKFELINPIEEKYSPIEQVLINRGIPLQEIEHYLNPTEDDNLDPSLLNNIQSGIQILMRHLLNEDNEILVIVDCDADGYCSAALFINYLIRRFPSSVDKIRYALHSDKSHGIMTSALSNKTSLVVAIDSSSNEYDIHEFLALQGIDVLVLDHHHADNESECACIINNQLSPKYPNKALCGTGIVYKFCRLIDIFGNTNIANDFLDLVAIANVGDMMDLRSQETHYLVQKGLHQIKNPFLQAMWKKNEYSLGSQLTPMGVAFYIVPFINAMTRSGTLEEKDLLFSSMLEHKAYTEIPSGKRGYSGQSDTIVNEAIRICTNVKNRQTKNRDTNIEAIEKRIENQGLTDNKIILVKADGLNLNRNIVGLMSNEIMSKYQHPTTILSPVEEEDGTLYWRGSARGLSQSKFTDFRQFCEDSGLVESATGHANAFGLSIRNDNIDKFIEYSNNKLADMDFSTMYKVDFMFTSNSIKPSLILELGKYKSLWGQEVPQPYIALTNVAITKNMLTLMAKGTLKIALSNGIECIKFRASQEEYDALYTSTGSVNINLIGQPEINEYCGRQTPQLLIKDYEIIGKQDFYF